MGTCERCKKIIINPVMHEFCEWKIGKGVPNKRRKTEQSVFLAEEQVAYGGEKPHRVGKVFFKQKPLVHAVAAAGAKPPVIGVPINSNGLATRNRWNEENEEYHKW